MIHGFICECTNRRCRRRIYLKPVEYDRLAKIGMVLSPDCAIREDREIITGYDGYRIVRAQNAGRP